MILTTSLLSCKSCSTIFFLFLDLYWTKAWTLHCRPEGPAVKGEALVLNSLSGHARTYVKKRLEKIRNFSYSWVRYGISDSPIYKGAGAFCNPIFHRGPQWKKILPLSRVNQWKCDVRKGIKSCKIALFFTYEKIGNF